MDNQDPTKREEGKIEDGEDADDKGKANPKDRGMIDRIQESGKLAFTALMANAPPFELAESSKTSGSSEVWQRQNPRFESHGESSSQSTAHFDPSKTMKTSSNGLELREEFDSFLAGSQAALSTETSELQQPSQVNAGREDLDGLEVVTLLSQPDPLDQSPSLAEGPVLGSPQEMDQLRQTLFGAGCQYPFWETLLDFSPNFLAGQGSASDMALHSGDVDAATARSFWFQQWHDVLTSYNREVWGDLEPLVAEAKLEVDRLAAMPPAAGKRSDSVALERLRQILTHVRGSS